jgi:predicted nucleic acid-binding protein
VFWDTNLFIYRFEANGELSAQTLELWRRMRSRGDVLVTSALALGELLAGYSRRDVPGTTFERRMRATAEIVPFDLAAARHFAAIRADRGIAAPDAIHLACAAAAGADLFVTNDSRLSRRIVPGVPIMTSLAAVPI